MTALHSAELLKFQVPHKVFIAQAGSNKLSCQGLQMFILPVRGGKQRSEFICMNTEVPSDEANHKSHS